MDKTTAQKGARVAKDGARHKRHKDVYAAAAGDATKAYRQEGELTGSSAQISSGVCQCGSQEQVSEEGSGRFWSVPACAGLGSGKFWRVPEAGSGRFQKVPARAGAVPEACSGGFRQVPSGGFRGVMVCWCRFRRKVPEGAGGLRSRFRRQGWEGSREFGCHDRSGHVIVLNTFW